MSIHERNTFTGESIYVRSFEAEAIIERTDTVEPHVVPKDQDNVGMRFANELITSLAAGKPSKKNQSNQSYCMLRGH
ncbi:hypothetical protein N9007_01195 [bacterium]|nr:hypothetical protein [bacterium]MDB4545102.1 hypothetical protein [bacterium]